MTSQATRLNIVCDRSSSRCNNTYVHTVCLCVFVCSIENKKTKRCAFLARPRHKQPISCAFGVLGDGNCVRSERILPRPHSSQRPSKPKFVHFSRGLPSTASDKKAFTICHCAKSVAHLCKISTNSACSLATNSVLGNVTRMRIAALHEPKWKSEK